VKKANNELFNSPPVTVFYGYRAFSTAPAAPAVMNVKMGFKPFRVYSSIAPLSFDFILRPLCFIPPLSLPHPVFILFILPILQKHLHIPMKRTTPPDIRDSPDSGVPPRCKTMARFALQP
jgi:hypothetical protein